MEFIKQILPYAQIVFSVVLIVAILLQQSGSNVGGALGGGDGSTFHSTRRGFEKFLFFLAIVCGVLFAVSALFSVILSANS